jgi:hypothetical protein
MKRDLLNAKGGTPLLCLLALLLQLLVAANLEATEKTTREIFEGAKDSIVLILAYDRDGVPVALGSGFFVEENKVVSNFHVVEGAAKIVLRQLGKKEQDEAKQILKFSKKLDLAVLETTGPGKPLPLYKEQRQGIGDRVVAIGNPRGLEGTVSEGIISSLRPTEDFKILQITAAISPGSSGGPLFDAEGRVIGVTTATLAGGQNLNFAVPILLLDRLEKGGGWEPQKVESKLEPQRGNAGLAVSDFAKRSQYDNEISYTLQNETKNDIKNVFYLLLFKNVETGKMVHFELFMDRDVIPAGLAKRFKRSLSRLYGLSTDREFLEPNLRRYADGVITAELRTLSYEIVRQQKDTVLDFLEKN